MPYYKKQMRNQINKVFEKLEKSIYTSVKQLNVTAWITPEPVSFEEKCNGEKKELAIGDSWGELWDCGWFLFTGEVPESCNNQKVVLLIDVSGEGCVFDHNGCPIRGLTNLSSTFDRSLGKPGKRVVQFLDSAKGGEKVELWVETGCNDLFGDYKDKGTLKEASIALCDEDMRQLYYDFEVLNDMLHVLPEEGARYNSILFALYEASKSMVHYTGEEVNQARDILAKELNKKGGDPSLTVSAVGHAHIDLAWLWPIRETIRKGSRTFSTALELIDRYPDYVFGASQPQLYQWMKDKYPLLYDKIKDKVKEGRWETQGGMWVEADTNISGGEALVRQVLYGKRFFRDEFQKDMKVLWLPDVFGYTAALPQILKKSGIDYFMTIKLSWSAYNVFPHHTFNWEGIDGTKILAHMPPEGTYNSSASPGAIAKAEKAYIDKGVSDECLMLFGIGDGGGGPGAEHLERLDRMKNLNGIAPVKQEPAINFFQSIEKNVDQYKTWVGELYLELHQGTLTTQGKNKFYNRKLEIGLRELEYAAIMAATYANTDYPQDEIERIWKEVLLYQFHDILPGSSIKRVYDESVERYEALYDQVKQLTETSYHQLAQVVDTSHMSDPYIFFNSLPWTREEWISVEDKWIHTHIPGMGYAAMDISQESKPFLNLTVEKNSLENDYLKVDFNEQGLIHRIYDKENHREVLDSNTVGNCLVIYDDEGDAWDFPINYKDLDKTGLAPIKSKVFIDGPKAVMEQTYNFGDSEIIQEISLTDGGRKIDFNTKVSWHERNKMLRTLFPVNVYTNEATFDIQFGSIKRPTHDNTTWDMAKYEVCAHKWADLSQRDYGVALLNDCKYGYSVKDNTMSLNLLRSPNYPGVDADKGEHQFTYSLYPHKGDHVEAKVDQLAEELNTPFHMIKDKDKTATLTNQKSFISLDSEYVMIESVKKAEDSNRLIIRMVETAGMNVHTMVTLDKDVQSVQLVDLMEEHPVEVLLDHHVFNIDFKPFEIQTVSIQMPDSIKEL